MKTFHIKSLLVVATLALGWTFSSQAQVNISAPSGLNRGTQQEPERKTEPTTSETTTENTIGESSENNAAAQPASTGTTVKRPATSSVQRPVNNSAVNAAVQERKPWVDSKKPESLNRDFSTGKNSNNLQSRQEVEMRSYGYRILVYHTNKAKNAKANAQKRAKDISVKFPQYQFYFNYKAPTWRLRLGDFAQEEDALRAMKQLRQAFPIYAKEMTIIHDHINVWK